MKVAEIQAAVQERETQLEELFRAGAGEGEERRRPLMEAVFAPQTQRLLRYSDTLYYLTGLCRVAGQEELCGRTQTVLDSLTHIAQAGERYTDLCFLLWRLENDIPPQEWPFGMAYVREHGISGVALLELAERETREKERNLEKAARLLQQEGMLREAIELLLQATVRYPENETLRILLAQGWLSGGEYRQALVTLQQLQDPPEEVRQLLQTLEQVLKDGT